MGYQILPCSSAVWMPGNASFEILASFSWRLTPRWVELLSYGFKRKVAGKCNLKCATWAIPVMQSRVRNNNSEITLSQV